MKAKLFPISIAVIGIVLLLIQVNAKANPAAFPVIDADAVFEAAIASDLSVDLGALVDQLPDGYFPVRASDTTHWREFQPLPGLLETLLEVLPSSYFPVRSSDGTHWREFQPLPGLLETLLEALPWYYFPVRSSDSTFIAPFQYPTQLLGDTTPPQIFNVSIDYITGLVEWQTNEFANSEVWYRIPSGTSTLVVSNTLWVMNHQMLLPGLTGDVEFILIRSADRSGNVGEYHVPGYSISGSVQDSLGNPIPNVVISVSPTQVALTDENGDYTLQGVAAGDYVITPYHPEYEFVPEAIAVTLEGDLTGQDFVGEQEHVVYIPLVIRSR